MLTDLSLNISGTSGRSFSGLALLVCKVRAACVIMTRRWYREVAATAMGKLRVDEKTGKGKDSLYVKP